MSGPVDLCALSDLPNGTHRAFAVEGRSILVFHIDGKLHAIDNRCSHLDFPLEGGRQIGCEIICRHHGARFDIRSGKALGGPAVDPVKVHHVTLRDGRVLLEVLAGRALT